MFEFHSSQASCHRRTTVATPSGMSGEVSLWRMSATATTFRADRQTLLASLATSRQSAEVAPNKMYREGRDLAMQDTADGRKPSSGTMNNVSFIFMFDIFTFHYRLVRFEIMKTGKDMKIIILFAALYVYGVAFWEHLFDLRNYIAVTTICHCRGVLCVHNPENICLIEVTIKQLQLCATMCSGVLNV